MNPGELDNTLTFVWVITRFPAQFGIYLHECFSKSRRGSRNLGSLLNTRTKMIPNLTRNRVNQLLIYMKN